MVACVFNFSDRDLYDYRLGFPVRGAWREILNTAATEYGGHGVGNLGQIVAVDAPSHGRPYSATITLPAASAVFFTRRGNREAQPSRRRSLVLSNLTHW